MDQSIKDITVEKIATIAREAGEAIMPIYEGAFEVTYKSDSSPLTEADLKAHTLISEALQRVTPAIPILSEEGQQVAYATRKAWEYYWCIDPIDGTKEFVKRNGEFTINIALIHRDTPILGVVYVPVAKVLYAAKQGEGAFKDGQRLPLTTNTTPEKKLRVVASKSHLSPETQAFIDALETQEVQQRSYGSSLKLCMVATGEADIYPRMAPTMEWDTAAADAIVREAGKMTYRFEDNQPMRYNKEDLLNPWFVVR